MYRPILSNIESLEQHQEHTETQIENYMPCQCPHCGHHKLWKHGYYWRQSDRFHHGKASLNPVKIPRYRCAHCQKTCSTLPECIPPGRWYLWETQEKVLSDFIMEKSYRAIAHTLKVGRSTVARWINRFNDCFTIHADHLRQQIPDLCFVVELKSFWKFCLDKASLSKFMMNFNSAGIVIP